MESSVLQRRRVLATSPFQRAEAVQPTTADFSVGGRVTHERFGMGRIVAVDPEYLTVDFGGGGAMRRFRAGARGLERL